MNNVYSPRVFLVRQCVRSRCKELNAPKEVAGDAENLAMDVIAHGGSGNRAIALALNHAEMYIRLAGYSPKDAA